LSAYFKERIGKRQAKNKKIFQGIKKESLFKIGKKSICFSLSLKGRRIVLPLVRTPTTKNESKQFIGQSGGMNFFCFN